MTLFPIGARPFSAIENAGTPSDFIAATAAPNGQVFLVVVKPYKLGATRAPAIRAQPLGVSPLCVITNATGGAGLVTLFYSDTGYVSPSRGNNSDIWFEGRVTQPLRMSWTLPVVPEADRRVALEISSLAFINADGALDSLVNSYDIGGREVTVYFGLQSYAFDQFVPVWSGRALDWTRDFSHLQITARDSGYLLDVPLQSTVYQGTGGAEGGATMANKPKPVCFGKCRNITPQAVDTSNLIYQFHSRAVQAVDAVYDKGVALTVTTDYANYALLAAAAPGAGNYATCLAQGMVKLGSTPAGSVTMDVRGDAVGGYISSTGGIAKRLLTDFVGIGAGQIVTQDFANFDAMVPGVIGWYQDANPVQAHDAMSTIVGHCSGWWGGLPDGRFTVGRLDTPSESTLALDLQAYDIEDAEIIAAPDGTMPPRFRQRVGYQRNWTVQAPSDLAAGVTAANVLARSQPYLVSANSNTNTLADFLLAQDPQILESLFDAQADADAEALRLENLLGVMRQTVRVKMKTVGHSVPRGASVATTMPRINGGARWLGRFIGVEIDASQREVDLILWG